MVAWENDENAKQIERLREEVRKHEKRVQKELTEALKDALYLNLLNVKEHIQQVMEEAKEANRCQVEANWLEYMPSEEWHEIWGVES